MFEHDQQVVNSLLNENKNFRRLYDKHSLLKRAVQEANQGHSNAEGLSLEELKSEAGSKRPDVGDDRRL